MAYILRLVESRLLRRLKRDKSILLLGPRQTGKTLAAGRELIPIEVKWTGVPSPKDIRHLRIFINEYPKARSAYVVCRTPRPIQVEKDIQAIPWQKLGNLLS